jgi:hypothetical protein
MQVLIGADPELFAFDKSLGQYVSVHNLLEGDKKNPMPVKHGAVQVDGTAAEFNITAAASEKEFMDRIAIVHQQIESIIQKRNPNVVLVSQPWVEYPMDYWTKEIPAFNKVLGCDPDYNAYTGEANPRPDPDKIGRPSLRTGSGHVHIGWRKPSDDMGPLHIEDCKTLVRALDDHLLPAITNHFDKDTVRRELYGKPGAFRPKPYGVEYRVLSNAWVDKQEAARLVYQTTYCVTNALAYHKSNKINKEVLKIYTKHFIPGFYNNLLKYGVI